MTLATLTTVHDPGAAELVADAVREAGIPVQLRRVRGDRYFGALVEESFQVRVPPEHLPEASAILRLVEREAELALSEQTGAFSSEACRLTEEADDEGDGPAPRSRRHGAAVRSAAPALLSILGAIVLGGLYRHGCAFTPVPGTRSPRAAARTDSIAPAPEEHAPRLYEDVRAPVTFGAACQPQLLCLPSRRQ